VNGIDSGSFFLDVATERMDEIQTKPHSVGSNVLQLTENKIIPTNRMTTIPKLSRTFRNLEGRRLTALD
jgi:hypothetical protein